MAAKAAIRVKGRVRLSCIQNKRTLVIPFTVAPTRTEMFGN